MEKFVSDLIRNVTGKTLYYKDSFLTSTKEVWFMDATFDEKQYRVVSFCEDGIVKMYKKHPLDQKGPTHTIKFFCA